MNQQTLSTHSIHYKGTVLLEFMEYINSSFFFGSLLKYIFRYPAKNGSTDIKKALDYLSWINFEKEYFFKDNYELDDEKIKIDLIKLIKHFNMEDNTTTNNIINCLMDIRQETKKTYTHNNLTIDLLKIKLEMFITKLLCEVLDKEKGNL